MFSVEIICVGKLKERFYIDAAAEYQKRLSPFCKLRVIELQEERLPQNPSQALITAALKKEAAAIRSKLPPNASTVALCIEGKLRSSQELADLLRTWENSPAKHLVFLIGSSYGLDEELKNEAWIRLSMSPMTFPHHLARVMLLEQVYRAFQINAGSPYHK
ncbi:MAG: 23S rRNA (pseudouridine(1915)-N(3))-methyltransferase RlmH [Oscillospiraceae bacterium]|jgi:23S rRNA (pseudouridine1915-N3)-methyltransferase|nr:23S rRNA (pseudouridine(1915)-N(3))-methyltransferase RlmH [Oscillospiraceae bacterium]